MCDLQRRYYKTLTRLKLFQKIHKLSEKYFIQILIKLKTVKLTDVEHLQFFIFDAAL